MDTWRFLTFAAMAACLTFLACCTTPADAGIFFDRNGGCPSCQQCQGATCPAPVPPVAIPPVPVAKITPPAAVQAEATQPATITQMQTTVYATQRPGLMQRLFRPRTYFRAKLGGTIAINGFGFGFSWQRQGDWKKGDFGILPKRGETRHRRR